MKKKGKIKNRIVTKIGASFLAVSMSTTMLTNYLNIDINTVQAVSTGEGISAFPVEYQTHLKALQEKHPNWTFTALYTGLEWNDVINAETTWGKSLVPKSYDSWWKLNDAEVESGWVNASRAAVEYAMNPLNYINSEQQIFQFETLSYKSNYQNQEGVESILYGTSMSGIYKDDIKYLDNQGNTLTISKKYSQVIMDAAIATGVSPYHLASRIRQETGCDVVNNLSINGKYNQTVNGEYLGDYRGLYNFYNIGASGAHPVRAGLKYAKTPGSYGEPWDNPEKAIKGGAMFIKDKFIGRGQNTLYFEKFNVTGNGNYGNQYMTNILAPKGEATFVYNTYAPSADQPGKVNGLNFAHNFTIPVYNNMPGATNSPEFQDDYTRVYLSATDLINDGKDYDSFSVRSEPNTGGERLKVVKVYYGDKNSKDSQVQVIRIAKGTGDYDKVKIKDLREGYEVEGYVANTFVKELNYPKVTGITIDQSVITLNVDNTKKINSTVTPGDAWFTNVKWNSDNSQIASVDSNGNVKAIAPGETIITATTEDQNKVATCKVVVTSNVTGITLPKENYTLVKGSTQKIEPTISPSNATNKEYTLTSDKTSVVTIDGKNIKAVGVGTANVTYTTTDGNKKVIAKIKVIENVDQSIEFKDMNVDKENGFVSKIVPGSKVQDIQKQIITNLKMEFKNKDGKIITNNEVIGTGSSVDFIINDTNDCIATYTFIIFGDINGDSKIMSGDYVVIKNHIMSEATMNKAQLKAADVNKDGKITSGDYVKIKNYIMGDSSLIVQ